MARLTKFREECENTKIYFGIGNTKGGIKFHQAIVRRSPNYMKGKFGQAGH